MHHLAITERMGVAIVMCVHVGTCSCMDFNGESEVVADGLNFNFGGILIW